MLVATFAGTFAALAFPDGSTAARVVFIALDALACSLSLFTMLYWIMTFPPVGNSTVAIEFFVKQWQLSANLMFLTSLAFAGAFLCAVYVISNSVALFAVVAFCVGGAAFVVAAITAHSAIVTV